LRVLIITYYWPPAGGSGVQRWLKFVKYLQDFDITPVVYTANTDNYPIEDSSLLREVPKNVKVLKTDFKEPTSFLKYFGVKNSNKSAGFLEEKPSLLGKVIRYIRANYFIPDAKMLWVKPSIKYLQKYLKENPVDTIITTGPPHSLHLIGLELKKQLGVKWISDFRDPWTTIDYFHQLPLTQKTFNRHQQLEKSVVETSDGVIVIGNYMKQQLLKYNDKIKIITNGFDSMDNASMEVALDQKFSITHIGLINSDRNPRVLWSVLSEICNEDEEFKNDLLVRLIGKVDKSVLTDTSIFNSDTLNVIDYVTHEEARLYQRKSQVLLLAVNRVPNAEGIITGKIFEYLEAKRPILGIGPVDGDAGKIINKANAGKMIDFDDKQKMKSFIVSLYHQFKSKTLKVNNSNIKQYHRKNLTADLSNFIREVVK